MKLKITLRMIVVVNDYSQVRVLQSFKESEFHFPPADIFLGAENREKVGSTNLEVNRVHEASDVNLFGEKHKM